LRAFETCEKNHRGSNAGLLIDIGTWNEADLEFGFGRLLCVRMVAWSGADGRPTAAGIA
jgi:hypothetical protein